MRHRILTVILGLCVLFGVILALPGCSSSKENGETYAYIFFPNGKCWFREKLKALRMGQMASLALRLTGLSIRHIA